jgi:hypothetical protein
MSMHFKSSFAALRLTKQTTSFCFKMVVVVVKEVELWRVEVVANDKSKDRENNHQALLLGPNPVIEK